MQSTIYASVYGGLGNQLFMIATAIAYSKKYNKKLHCFYNPIDARDNYCGLPVGVPISSYYDFIYNEPSFSYKEIPYFENNFLINGYFQSSKYFSKEIIDSINIPKTADYAFPVIPDGKTPVCIHVRRTDYLNSDFHPTSSNEYYALAIALIRKRVSNPYFLIFSDDIEYVTTNTLGDICENERVIIDKRDIDCINIMKECKYFIIANSSFSWWGAMMGGYNLVIAPKKWFGKDGPQDWQDIYEPDWIII